MKPHKREVSSKKKTFKPERNRLIATIHVAKKELGLGDDLYRDILFATTEKDSLRDMSVKDLQTVIEAFEKQGFKKKTKGKKPNKKLEGEIKLIRALWISLHQLGEVKNPSEQALNAYVKRMAKVDNLNWISHKKAEIVIASLRDWMKRAGYIRPDAKHYKLYGFINSNSAYQMAHTETNINAAHVLMTQLKKVFQDNNEYRIWLVEQGITHHDHPYAFSIEEIRDLCGKLAQMIEERND